MQALELIFEGITIHYFWDSSIQKKTYCATCIIPHQTCFHQRNIYKVKVSIALLIIWVLHQWQYSSHKQILIYMYMYVVMAEIFNMVVDNLQQFVRFKLNHNNSRGWFVSWTWKGWTFWYTSSIQRFSSLAGRGGRQPLKGLGVYTTAPLNTRFTNLKMISLIFQLLELDIHVFLIVENLDIAFGWGFLKCSWLTSWKLYHCTRFLKQ